jgi:hypothetical protein
MDRPIYKTNTASECMSKRCKAEYLDQTGISDWGSGDGTRTPIFRPYATKLPAGNPYSSLKFGHSAVNATHLF